LEWATKDLEIREPTSEIKLHSFYTLLTDVGQEIAKLENCGFQGGI
jgi:hypothetical protein